MIYGILEKRVAASMRSIRPAISGTNFAVIHLLATGTIMSSLYAGAVINFVLRHR